MTAQGQRRWAAVVLGSVLAAFAGGRPAVAAASIPYTPGLDTAAMDRTADPCEDFYQYACGGWRAANPIPPDQSAWSVYGKLHQDNLSFLRTILEDTAAGGAAGRGEDEQKIGDFYAACMDTARIDQLGMQPVAPLLQRIGRAVPARQLAAVLGQLQAGLGGHEYFELTAEQDFNDATAVIAWIYGGGLGLPDRDYYLADDARSVALRAAYQAHVGHVFALAGSSPVEADRAAATVMRLETALARASLSRVDLRDPQKLNHRMNRAALGRLAPHFDWTTYFATLGLSNVAVINVAEPALLREFDHLLSHETPAATATYLRWHVLHDAAPYLSAAFRQEHFQFYSRTLRGQQEEKPRWKTCVAAVDQRLGDALGRQFVVRAFSSEQKQATLRMTRQIEQQMRRDLESLTWLSAATKAEGLKKLNAIVNKIGYPDHWRDYASLQVQPGDFYGNTDRAAAFEVRRQLAKIGQPLDRTEWMMSPPTVNAYYDPQMNDINFPAGVLQPPLYDPAMDDAPNYGDTGGTIGHELTHGFDDEGRQFDAAGNLRDWWTEADSQAFADRTQCIVDQYADYVVVDDIHINSRLTLGEDVADLGGLILAYQAWLEETAAKTLTPREGMTPQQRFFVGYAQWACENTRPESERLQAKTDPHSPGRYRVNGLVVNMPEFEQAFACHKGQAMVRENRCRVW